MRLVTGLVFAATVAILILGCGSSEDGSQPASQTTTPTATSTPTPTAVATTTPSNAPLPTASPLKTQTPGGDPFDMSTWAVVPVPTGPTPDIPDSWNTLTSKGAVGYEFRYPETWFSDSPNRVLSFDPSGWTTSSYPPGGVIFEVQVGLIGSSAERQDEAIDKSVDGASGWEIVRVRDVTSVISSVARVHTIGLDHGEYQLFLVGFFDDRDADETIFRQIVSGFRLTQAAQ